MAPPDSSNGALLIGVLVSTFFQGILSVQAYIYYENFPEDPLLLKALVGFVWTLDFVHLVLISQAMYYYLITNWGNVAALGLTTIELDLHLVFLSVATFTCQAYFLHRVWRFSNRNKLLTGVLTAGCTSTLVLDLFLAAQTIASRNETKIAPSSKRISIAVFSTGGANDLAIALVLCWYLQRRKSEFDRTNIHPASTSTCRHLSDRYSLLALGTLAAYVGSPDTFIWLAMYISLGRMYTNALLATLNSRWKLRALLLAPPMGATEIFGSALRSVGHGTVPESPFHEEGEKWAGVPGVIS
ncbi:ANK-REP-REGION domain-containing protein [Mycena venus]|uniref:ANK-REP-REGION domain-containing protein n=1 Tax=Mycena venus TaxID=2733690 RepID=A0A8H7CZ86_9AGAR|nr:ANK-REP-REGION domain-containing protein [Mycena venus]